MCVNLVTNDLCGAMSDLNIVGKSDSTYLLDKLLAHVNQNKQREKGGYRYEKVHWPTKRCKKILYMLCHHYQA